MDQDIDYFIWAVNKFQNITVSQAQHFKDTYGLDFPSKYIEDVPPYEHKKGDPEELYMELCNSPRPDLNQVLAKYRKWDTY